MTLIDRCRWARVAAPSPSFAKQAKEKVLHLDEYICEI
jgi:hypothetical protein